MGLPWRSPFKTKYMWVWDGINLGGWGLVGGGCLATVWLVTIKVRFKNIFSLKSHGLFPPLFYALLFFRKLLISKYIWTKRGNFNAHFLLYWRRNSRPSSVHSLLWRLWPSSRVPMLGLWWSILFSKYWCRTPELCHPKFIMYKKTLLYCLLHLDPSIYSKIQKLLIVDSGDKLSLLPLESGQLFLRRR